MKKILLVTIILAAALGPAFSQNTSLSITGPTSWTPGTSITLSVNLTFSGFNAVGLSYWLQTNNALASHLSITNLTHFTFPIGYTGPYPIPFDNAELGGSVNYPTMKSVPPGSYHVTDITIFVDGGAPPGMYTIVSSTTSPRISEVTDTAFNDHNIPQSSFVFNVVPEPSTLALLGIGAIGSGLCIYRRRKDRDECH